MESGKSETRRDVQVPVVSLYTGHTILPYACRFRALEVIMQKGITKIICGVRVFEWEINA